MEERQEDLCRYELAYAAAIARLAQQDGTLGNLRNRATGLLTVAALVASFSSAIGLVSEKKPIHEGFGWELMLALVAIGVCAMAVLWPCSKWKFGPSPGGILKQDGDEKKIREAVTNSLVRAIGSNESQITRRALWYRWGAALLLLEAILVVAATLVEK
ncbi:hypothetical protein [Streptomyces sp. NBC_00162]|uniref:hypothetical protein n=1 Tax=Streptomyces sp. NBC_00162 TaxID=2903629 RepID=UPI00214C55B8|nr:hypothetical protein [Streptomyces sp. NBC_00162]UUU37618.1 hypothetical protein JIW86_00955 [Streptomyces sp. NBC_00162]